MSSSSSLAARRKSESDYRSEGSQDETLSIVVLGASGDLAKKKTFPALYALYVRKLLPESTIIYGYARSHLSNDDFRKQVSKAFKGGNEEAKGKFMDMLHYFAGQYDKSEDFHKLDEELVKSEKQAGKGTANRIFYLAVPPEVFVPAAHSIRTAAASKSGWTRLIVEKPFGRDLASSTKLSNDLAQLFSEKELFRIDHYLGKEMVQNLMVMRFANAVFEPMWNRHHIANVQITFKEDIGTEGRGGYFDQYGIIRDVMQNHLIQMLALVAMEPPVTLSASDIQDEKVKLLRAIPPVELKDVVIGQYVKGKGSEPGYIDSDDKIPRDSTAPTFATAILYVRNSRWADVPFILRCGKALDDRKAEIRIQFRQPASFLFNDDETPPNELVLRVQPNEAVYLKMNQKRPGLTTEMQQSELDLTYKDRFGSELSLPDAYERLVLDVIRNDHNLFVRDDELEEAWKIFTPLLHRLDKEKTKPEPYEFGSRGPASSDELIKRAGYVRSLGYKWPGKL
eukprot:TRINITY_DN2026_c0_g1_i3.p1 TRINITY_DN2026_c0_g1~~TRINITY_DN2026_c0_g1_i3.p1  ORF type:complete len:509 (+),score=142.79 TRINITY_DN2026_c0_g1_i3:241-1767(+)